MTGVESAQRAYMTEHLSEYMAYTPQEIARLREEWIKDHDDPEKYSHGIVYNPDKIGREREKDFIKYLKRHGKKVPLEKQIQMLKGSRGQIRALTEKAKVAATGAYDTAKQMGVAAVGTISAAAPGVIKKGKELSKSFAEKAEGAYVKARKYYVEELKMSPEQAETMLQKVKEVTGDITDVEKIKRFGKGIWDKVKQEKKTLSEMSYKDVQKSVRGGLETGGSWLETGLSYITGKMKGVTKRISAWTKGSEAEKIRTVAKQKEISQLNKKQIEAINKEVEKMDSLATPGGIIDANIDMKKRIGPYAAMKQMRETGGMPTPGIVDTIKTEATGLWGKVKSLWNKWTGGKDMARTTKQFSTDVISSISTKAQEAYQDAKNFYEKELGLTQESATMLASEVYKKVSETGVAVTDPELLKKIGKDVVEGAREIQEDFGISGINKANIEKFSKDISDKIKEGASSVVDKSKIVITQATLLLADGSNVIDKLSDGLKENAEKIVEGTKEGAANISNNVNNVVTNINSVNSSNNTSAVTQSGNPGNRPVFGEGRAFYDNMLWSGNFR